MPHHTSVHGKCCRPCGEVTVSLLFLAILCQARTVSPKRPCAQLLGFSAPGVEVSKAQPVPASDALPAYCLLQGTINKRIGAGGKQFGIGFELRLPDAWTCLLYTSPSPRDRQKSRMPSSA